MSLATTSLALFSCLDGIVEVGVSVGAFLLEVLVQTRSQVHEESVSLEEDSVTATRHDSCDLTGSLNPSQFQESWRSGQGSTEEGGSPSLTLSLDNGRFLVLKGLVDEELCPLGLLLRNLFFLDSLGELGSEMQVDDGNIIEHDIKVFASLSQTVSDLL